MVVDSNYMQSDKLSAYLARSKSNFVVLSDYTDMEAFKGNTLKSAFKSYQILCKYPKQVLILKTTARLAALRGRPSGLQRRMIDDYQTSDFGNWCRTLARARGNPQLEAGMLAYGRNADAHLSRVKQDLETFFRLV
jgi:hypothetical protein